MFQKNNFLIVYIKNIRRFSDLNKYSINKSIRIAQAGRMESTLLSPPKGVRGMIELDKSKFIKHVKVPHLHIEDVNTSSIIPYIKKYLLKMENLKPIQGNEKKSALLNPSIVKNWLDIELSDRENLAALGVSEKRFRVDDVTLKYENWRADEIFKAVLPIDKDSLSSYSKIGHIVHVNLKDHHIPYKKLIGNVLFDKVKSCRTVVNKTETIDTAYRFFKMEVLAGDDDMRCIVRENHCRFEFDFSTVYWNPRLCTEHERITQMLSSGDVLYDVFAGVGPFSIPAAKKNVVVLANDLNPESYKWLNCNAKLNKIQPNLLKIFNKDGREFITNDLKNDFLNRIENEGFVGKKAYIVMNLPGLAVEFLDAFYCLCKLSENHNTFIETIVHVYCFVDGDDPKTSAIDKVESGLGVQLGHRLREVFNVRNVSPKKDMMRVTFELTRDILCGTCGDIKKRKLDQDSNLVDANKRWHGEKEERRIKIGSQNSSCEWTENQEESESLQSAIEKYKRDHKEESSGSQ